MTTEREVVYTKEDLWFSPYYDYPSRDEPLELSQNNDDENFNRVKNNFYGFRLPTSSRAHDYLLATKNCVIVKSDEEPSADPTKTAKHHDDQLIRRLKNVFGV